MPPLGVLDMSRREETPGKTQENLMCLYHQAGQGTCWDPLGRAGGTIQGEGSLGVPAQAAAQTLDKAGEWRNGQKPPCSICEDSGQFSEIEAIVRSLC